MKLLDELTKTEQRIGDLDRKRRRLNILYHFKYNLDFCEDVSDEDLIHNTTILGGRYKDYNLSIVVAKGSTENVFTQQDTKLFLLEMCLTYLDGEDYD